jgi:hypothetical protein
MRAGNCSAVQELAAPNELHENFGATEYIPSLDSMIWTYEFDDAGYGFPYLFNMSSPSDPPTTVNTSNWWYNRRVHGDFFYQSNGTLWALGQSYGPAASVMFQVNIGNNITAIQEGAPIDGFGIRTILPRAVHALSDGPVPTAPLTKWRTGYAGAIAFVMICLCSISMLRRSAMSLAFLVKCWPWSLSAAGIRSMPSSMEQPIQH